MHELPLVFFTVFGQLAAGLVFITSFCYLTNNKEGSLRKIETANIAALIVMAFGMFIASFHLGHPFRALNVIFGIGRSPMSNEIFTFGVLFGITFVSVLLAYFSKSNNGNKLPFIKNIVNKVNKIPGVDKLIAILLIVGSLFFVWTIVLTYMLPTVKTWDTYYTAIQMYTTMLVLGGLAATVFGLHRAGILLLVIGVAIILICKIPYANAMASLSPSLAQAQYCFWGAESLLILVSLIITLINTIKGNKSMLVYSIAFVLALMGELCGRIAFYNLWEIPM